MRIWSRQSPHGDALPLASEEFVGGAKLEREMERQLADGPGPVAVRARASGQESSAERLGVAALEPGDATADVPDVVRVATTGDRQHQLQVAQRRPRVVRSREDPRVVDGLDRVQRQIADHPRDRDVAAADAADRMEGM